MAISIPQQDIEINGHLYRRMRNGSMLIKDPAFSWVDERQLPVRDRPWRPFEQLPPIKPDGTPGELGERETFWANSHYLVHRREMPGTTDPTDFMIHLSMRTVENDARHDWREMQRVKNELAGPDWEAVELYPQEDRVVDMANQFHLWCLHYRFPFGFESGLRAEQPEIPDGAVQRPGAGDMPVPPDPAVLAAAQVAGMCDHADRCCKKHGTHSMPHRGCVLR